MVETPDAGVKVPSNFGNFPIHGKDNILGIEQPGVPRRIQEKQIQDILEVSETSQAQTERVSHDKPTIAPPNQEKVNGANLQQAVNFIKANPWFFPSFLATLTVVLNDLSSILRQMHLNEALDEQRIRELLYENAKSSAKLAKELMNNQAREQMVQAVSAFANAAVSGGQAIGTVRNVGAATDKVQQEIDAKRRQVDSKEIEEFKNDPGIVVAENIELKDLPALKAQHPNRKESAELQKLKNQLQDLEYNKSRNITSETDHKDRLVQSLADMQKQTINGVSAVLQGMIKADSSVKEEMQKLIEGFIQAMNKYSESLAKSRDDSAANFTRFLDFLNKMVESEKKAMSARPG